MIARRLGLVAALVSLAAPARSHANGSTVLVLVDPDSGVGAAIARELRAAGLEPRVRDTVTTNTDHVELESIARAESVGAVVRVHREGGRVSLWLTDRFTRKSSVRTVQWTGNHALLAVQVVELLRASLLEIDLPSTLPPEVAPPPAVRRLVARPSPPARSESFGVGFFLGGGVSLSVGVDPALMIRADMALSLGRWAQLAIVGQHAAMVSSLGGPEGASRLHWTTLGASWAVRLRSADARFALDPGLVVGAVNVEASGSTMTPFVGRSAQHWGFYGALAVTGAAQLTPGIRVRFAVDVGLVAPAAEIRFADRLVAVWGEMLVSAALGVEAGRW